MLLSADVLWLISLSPVALVALIVVGCLVGGAVQARHAPVEDPEAVGAYWAEIAAGLGRHRRIGTPEPATPVPARISLYTATLAEAMEYLRNAREHRAREHREFLTLIRA